VASDGGSDVDHGFDSNHIGNKPLSDPLMAESIKERFIDVIKNVDYLFAYLDTPHSYGSIAEIAYASAMGIPCLVILADLSEVDNLDDEEANFAANCKDWSDDGSMSDAYWFVSNFPLVYSTWAESEEHATVLFQRTLGLVLAESPIEESLWAAFLKAIPKTGGKIALPVPQYQLNGYRLDFAWFGRKVAVEVDGHDYHKTKEQRSYDAKRDRELTKMGWTTLRFTGSDVYKNADAVAGEVLQILLADTGV
jgi:very-short-patch-repair endonuclease